MKAITVKHRTPFYLLFVVTLSIALAACGGGGGGSSSVSGGTATIQGSVPGTVFVAVNDDTNLEVGRVTATGTPKTFSMDVPTGATYRFYVMENEGTANSRVYPMYMGTNNVFELDNTANGRMISLGMIRPDMGTGKATPANTPSLMMGRGANAMIPPSIGGDGLFDGQREGDDVGLQHHDDFGDDGVGTRDPLVRQQRAGSHDRNRPERNPLA